MAHKYIDKCINEGYIPSELIYIVKPLDYEEIDLDKIQYNDFHSFEFYAKRFPNYESIPGMREYIQSIADQKKENNITPLSEYQNIIKK